MVVSPNSDPHVITATVCRHGLAARLLHPYRSLGRAGGVGNALKLFPAEAASPAALKAQRAVLPKDMPLLAVGGITPEGMAPWRAAGADGFGLGSALYRPGATGAEVRSAAEAFVTAVKNGH